MSNFRLGVFDIFGYIIPSLSYLILISLSINIVTFNALIKKILRLEEHLYPCRFEYTFDHRLRKLIHNPNKILAPYLKNGDTVIDIGCSMAFFLSEWYKLLVVRESIFDRYSTKND